MSAKLKVVPSQPSPAVLLIEQPNLMWEFRGQTFEEHLICWQEIASEVERDSWMLGAIAASLVTKYNDSTIDRFAYEVRLSGRRVREIAQTYRAFQNGERSPILSFHHHTIAARGKDKGIDPVEAIHRAEDKEWSTRELDVFVKTGVDPEPRTQKPAKVSLPRQLQKLHDRAAQEHLDATILAVRKQAEAPPDPLLSSVYRRCIEIMEWQRDRSLETDCFTIMKVFASEEGSESPEEASDDYVAAWLTARGFIIGDDELGSAGCPKGCKANHEHDNEGSGRLGLMRRLKLLMVLNREASRGPTQRGSIPGVLSPDPGYFAELDRISANPRAPERSTAQHKDWIDRLKRYAPELLPKEKAA